MSSLKRPVHEIPSYVSDALKSKGLQEAYLARPPYQRNDYIGWITRARRQETINKRLNQMLEELRDGTKYMGMPYNAKKQRERLDTGFSKELIAPCGINCAVCYAYLRKKNRCEGCLTESDIKMGHCSKCGIKLCDEHNNSEFTYCFECPKYPCIKMKKIDKRYINSYKISLIGNLNSIQQSGIEEFITQENGKWICGNCGEMLSVHQSACLHCGQEYR